MVAKQPLRVVPHHVSEAAANAIPLDGVPVAPTDRVRDARRTGLRRAAATQHEWAPPQAASRCKGTKGAWVTDSPDQAESRVRPFNRRFFSSARPARVCIRWRNPCFLLRLRLLGWNVRFTHGLLGPRVGAQITAPGARARLRRPHSVRPRRRNQQSGIHVNGVLSLQKAGDTVPSPRQRTGPVGAVTSPEMFTFGLGEAARAAAGPGEGFLHTCGCCCGQPG
jgi:hypothetical protein